MWMTMPFLRSFTSHLGKAKVTDELLQFNLFTIKFRRAISIKNADFRQHFLHFLKLKLQPIFHH